MNNKNNILFLMLACPNLDNNEGDFYSDLALEFKDKGCNITIVAPALDAQETGVYHEGGVLILRVRTMNSVGLSSVLKKGLSLVLLPENYKKAYKKYLINNHFDYIFMPTPPITLVDFVSYVKEKTQAKFYLILRDIHPHSSRSIGMCNNPIIYKFLYTKAQKAYGLADYIGCMSPDNISFVNSIAPGISKEKIVLLPNWIKYEPFVQPDLEIRKKYGLENKYIAVFGGTIGVGQAIWNIIELAKHYKEKEDIVFLVVGKGIRKQQLIDMAKETHLENIVFFDYMPRKDYNELLKTADVGIISLDEKYAVPTCPSKAIGYMAMKIPVIALINRNSDYGTFYIDNSGIGFWSEGLDYKKAFADFDKLYKDSELRAKMGKDGYNYYLNNLTSKHACDLILSQIN